MRLSDGVKWVRAVLVFLIAQASDNQNATVSVAIAQIFATFSVANVAKKTKKGSNKNRPIMVLLDSLGQRWSLRIIWELQNGPTKFRALRDACDGVSPSVLNTRIRELRKLGFVEKTDDGYALTRDGESLADRLRKLDRWARRWDKRRRKH